MDASSQIIDHWMQRIRRKNSVETLENDFNLYGLDVSSSKSLEKIFQADISKPEQVQSVFSRILPLTYVVHLAGGPRSDAGWDSVFVNNIGGTKNIYEAARKRV